MFVVGDLSPLFQVPTFYVTSDIIWVSL